MIKTYNEEVVLKYNVYNSIFLMLKLERIRNTGILLPVFADACAAGFATSKDPSSIVHEFVSGHDAVKAGTDTTDLLFRFVQYIERQIVLIDAIEEAVFEKLNDVRGEGSLTDWLSRAGKDDIPGIADFKLRIVLTAHPTQFYPGAVLGIITDLTKAIDEEHLVDIKQLLLQLGKTPFFKRQKPTPFEEAGRLAWYLEHVLYSAAPEIYQEVAQWSRSHGEEIRNYDLVSIGFWPGGDRDGNPFVTTETTLDVARKLRLTLLQCYHRDVRRLKRRLTFRGVTELVQSLDNQLYQEIYRPKEEAPLSVYDLESTLADILIRLENEHNGLFVEDVERLLSAVRLFGLHFASLDIRQDSRVLDSTMRILLDNASGSVVTWEGWLDVELEPQQFTSDDTTLSDTAAVCGTILQIQAENGERACHRFVISNCGSAESVAQVYALARSSGFTSPMALDIVPLFETIDDLGIAAEVMGSLYKNEVYRKHLAGRDDRQVIMLGFSDGTKDGGYAAANWNIFLAKERITKVSRQHGITAVFFDGRGGPPARGGGNTHKYYAAQGNTIEQKEIQLTVQGQTVSSKFGNMSMARYNIEQLLTAGLKTVDAPDVVMTDAHRQLLQRVADLSFESYTALKQDPVFVRYLEEISPLPYFSRANIASRPGKRGRTSQLTLEDLRAISFVGAWSLLKQNVPGYYGLGYALQRLMEEGLGEDLKALYNECLWFKALLRNSMQSLAKCYFPLTEYISKDPVFGPFWQQIFDEYQRTKRTLIEIAGLASLLDDDPVNQASIALREDVVLPLLTIQQYGLMQLKANPSEEMKPIYEKLVVRAMYGIINAARNSA